MRGAGEGALCNATVSVGGSLWGRHPHLSSETLRSPFSQAVTQQGEGESGVRKNRLPCFPEGDAFQTGGGGTPDTSSTLHHSVSSLCAPPSPPGTEPRTRLGPCGIPLSLFIWIVHNARGCFQSQDGERETRAARSPLRAGWEWGSVVRERLTAVQTKNVSGHWTPADKPQTRGRSLGAGGASSVGCCWNTAAGHTVCPLWL